MYKYCKSYVKCVGKHLSKGETSMDVNTSKLRIFALQRKFERTLWVRALKKKEKKDNVI